MGEKLIPEEQKTLTGTYVRNGKYVEWYYENGRCRDDRKTGYSKCNRWWTAIISLNTTYYIKCYVYCGLCSLNQRFPKAKINEPGKCIFLVRWGFHVGFTIIGSMSVMVMYQPVPHVEKCGFAFPSEVPNRCSLHLSYSST